MGISYGEPLKKLRAVKIRDNGEPLIDPRDLSKRVDFAAEHPVFGDQPRSPLVRKTVAAMIAEAADHLESGLILRILEGFRPLHFQRKQYEHVHRMIAKEHPDWSPATVRRVTNSLSAPPDDPCPPPHSTGAAVDLYLVHTATGQMVDMTSPFDWDAKTAPMAHPDLSDAAKANRAMFRDVLSATGLTNYPGEWWHWSYGDSGWALRVGATEAIYDRIAET